MPKLLPHTSTPDISPAVSPWMSAQETSDYTGFTISALASMRYEHRGPAFSKPGGRIRYRRSDVDAWMATGSQRPSGRRSA